MYLKSSWLVIIIRASFDFYHQFFIFWILSGIKNKYKNFDFFISLFILNGIKYDILQKINSIITAITHR